MSIASWLRDLGLERYEQAFRDNEIDAEILPKLTTDDLKEIGVVAVGHRRKLLDAIANLADADPQQQAEEQVRTAPRSESDAGQAERRQLTIMFVDLVGSTELSVRFDPEDTSAMLRAYQNLVAGEITRYSGHIAKYLGDGVLAFFGYPKAHEDEAERAVRAALDLTRAVGKLTTPDGDPLAARVGIATGLVVVGELIGEGSAEERAVVGETPNLAARLEAIAEPGSVVIAPRTRLLVGELFELRDLGGHELKGFSKPITAYSVVGERRVASRFEARGGSGSLSPIVGRDRELALLLDRWALARNGEGQGALLVGEAGIGKSRIVRAFLDRLQDEPHRRIRYQCSPYHAESALWPVVQQLSHAAKLAPGDSDDIKLDKLDELLQLSGREGDAPLIAELMGLDSEARYGDKPALDAKAKRAQTLEALVMQLLGLVAAQPVLLVVEDVHWIDPTTLELIEHCLGRIASERIMILLTSRPDERAQLTTSAPITELTLDRLERADMEAIMEAIAARLGDDRLSTDVIETIVGRTDGVPLFVEELTRAMLEAGETSVPASLHDTLMTRLDRLSDVKEVAQTAACIGREFGRELLAAVVDAPAAQLERSLDRLVASELVFQRGTSPTVTYSFKHALVQEAAYHSLLKSKRRQLHARIVESLETGTDAMSISPPEVLAHHHSAAGQTERAIGYWWQAGQRAAERSANLEAIAHLSNGLAAFETLTPDQDQLLLALEMQVALGVALVAAKGWAAPDTSDAFARARELCVLTGDSTHLTKVNWGEQTGYLMRGPLSLALEKSEDMLKLAEDSQDDTALMMAHRTIGITSVHLGNAKAALQHLERAYHLYDHGTHCEAARQYGYDVDIAVAVYAAHPLLHLGYPDRARKRLKEALDEAHVRGHKPSLAFAYLHNGQFHQVFGDLPVNRELIERQIALCTEQGFDAWRASGQVQRGSILFQSGQEEAGLAEMEQALRDWRAPGVALRVPLFLIDVAKALAGMGDIQAAEARLSEALDVIDRSGERWHEPEIYRLKGELSLSSPEPNGLEAKTNFRKAIAAAREQEAKWPELRAATDLARWLSDRERRHDARDVLGPVYEWFTEGFDTPDLMAAKALLDELRQDHARRAG